VPPTTIPAASRPTRKSALNSDSRPITVFLNSYLTALTAVFGTTMITMMLMTGNKKSPAGYDYPPFGGS
jgi:hypothetical protein